MKKIIKEYFTFSTGEKNGILVLLLIIIGILIYIRYLSEIPTDSRINYAAFEKEIDAFQKSLIPPSQSKSFSPGDTTLPSDEISDTALLFDFDPNTIKIDDWRRLGLTEKQAASIEKYKTKGGRFRCKEDLKTMYSISELMYERLEPFIIINDQKSSSTKNIPIKKQEYTLFQFDPNTASQQELLDLGISEKLALNIQKYRNSGGKFKSNEDLKKIYGFPQNKYEELKAYIVISEDITIKKSDNVTFTGIIELNTASAEELTSLSGIGEYYSKKIIERRTLLGGFLQLDQLMELYNFKQETLDQISPHLTIDQTIVKKLNINTLSIEEMAKHPYMTWPDAKAIVNFRTKNGKFTTIDAVLLNYLLPEIKFNKLKPYLSVS